MTGLFNRSGEEYSAVDGRHCIKCGAELGNLDTALHKKMINRGADRFFCIKCLAEYIGVTEDDLLRKAEQFKKSGCTLF